MLCLRVFVEGADGARKRERAKQRTNVDESNGQERRNGKERERRDGSARTFTGSRSRESNEIKKK